MLARTQKVPAGGATAVRWHTEYADDPPGHSADGVAVLAEAARWCILDGLVKARGLKPGAEIDVAWSRYSRDGKKHEDDAWRLPFRVDANGRVEQSVGGQFALNSKNRLRLRVINPADAQAVVERVTMPARAGLGLMPPDPARERRPGRCARLAASAGERVSRSARGAGQDVAS